MSILNVDKIQPIGGGSTITVDATDIQATSATITASKFVGSGDLSVTGVSTFSGDITANGNITGDGSTDISGINDITASMLSISDTITHTGDTNTKIRFPAADTITAETAGSERLRIDSSGRVMIGNDDAASMFSVANNLVVGSGSGSEGITIFSDSSNDGYIVFADGTSDPAYRMGQIIYSHNSNKMQFRTNGNTDRLIIASDGDLTHIGADNVEYKMKCGTSSGNNIIAFLNSGGTTRGNITYDSDNNFLLFNVNQSERLRIASDGKVGINSTAPNKLLDVHSTNTNTYSSSASSTPNAGSVIQLTNTSGTDGSGSGYYTGINFAVGYGARSDGWLTYHRTGDNQGDFTFTSRNTASTYPELMRIKSNGSVGIGEAAPDTKLHVKSTGNASTVLKLEPGTTAGNYGGIELGRTDGSGNIRMTSVVKGGVPISGISGIEFGTSDTNLPAVSLASANTSNGHIVFKPKGTEAVRITSVGDILIGNTNGGAEAINMVGGGGGILISRSASGSPNDGQTLGDIGLNSYSSSQTCSSADVLIRGQADGAHSGSSAGSALLLFTKPASTGPGSAPTERLRITKDGSVNIGGDLAQSTHKFLVDNGTASFKSKIYVRGSLGFNSTPFGANVTYDTGISVNASGYGGSMLCLCSRNYGAGTQTQAALYFLKFHYDGNNTPGVYYITGNSNFATFAQSGSNTLTVAMGASNNMFTVIESSV